MAGHVELKRGLGANISQERDALYTEGDYSYVEFSSLDSASISSGDAPIGRPAGSDTAYSMEVWLYLQVTKAPDNKIDNIRFWGTDSNPNGIYFYVGTAISTANTPTSNKSTIAIYNSTAYTDESNSLLWSDTAMKSIGENSWALVMQARVDSAAAQGDESGTDCIFHYSYDEA